MRYISAISLLLLTFAVGCVTGIDPPEPTQRVLVEGGVFVFGSEIPCFDADEAKELTCDDDIYGMKKTYPEVKIDLKPFLVDVHEVTNAQYRYCVEMGNCPSPEWSNTENILYYWDNPVYDNFPVLWVSQEGAAKYCEFMDGRLPAEVEWERVAGGLPTVVTGGHKRVYPAETVTWDDLSTCGNNFLDIQVQLCSNSSEPAEVMSSADDYVLESDKKIYDLAGNVSEWVDGGFSVGVTCREFLDPTCDCWLCGDDSACRENCYTECDECRRDSSCYVMCEDDFAGLGLPVCLRYSGLVDAVELFDKGKNGKPLAKGGYYLIKASQTCQMTVAARTRTTEVGKGSLSIGFRCVEDVN